MAFFKVHCEFYVRANDPDQVETHCAEDELFVESHLLIESVDEVPDDDNIFVDLIGGKDAGIHKES